MRVFRHVLTIIVIIVGSSKAFTSNKAPAHDVTRASHANQCKLPVSQRKGGWLCMAEGGSQLPAAKGKCRFIKPLGKGAAWCYRDEGLTEFTSTGLIGYGKGVLGSVTVSFTVTLLSGGRSHSIPVAFRTTARHVLQLAVQGNRLFYSSACPAGCPIEPTVYSQHKFSRPVPRDRVVDWPQGYKATEKPVHDGAVFHQWVFHVHGYPDMVRFARASTTSSWRQRRSA